METRQYCTSYSDLHIWLCTEEYISYRQMYFFLPIIVEISIFKQANNTTGAFIRPNLTGAWRLNFEELPKTQGTKFSVMKMRGWPSKKNKGKSSKGGMDDRMKG